MGKKNRKKKEKKVKLPIPYTESERNRKITAIRLQLMNLNMDHVLTDEIKEGLQRFIKTGETYQTKLDLPQYSRVLEVNLVNDKRQSTHINLAFKKIMIPGEGDENPINKLNKLQENMFDG